MTPCAAHSPAPHTKAHEIVLSVGCTEPQRQMPLVTTTDRTRDPNFTDYRALPHGGVRRTQWGILPDTYGGWAHLLLDSHDASGCRIGVFGMANQHRTDRHYDYNSGQAWQHWGEDCSATRARPRNTARTSPSSRYFQTTNDFFFQRPRRHDVAAIMVHSASMIYNNDTACGGVLVSLS